MLILGVETSCDETSAAVVEDGRLVHSNVIASQVELHAGFGGVVPEIASRQHIRAIDGVVEEALGRAGVRPSELDSVAATQGPGLAGALLVGLNFARGLALGLGIPFVPVNHLEGHLHSVWLSDRLPLPPEPPLPMMALIVSGGHTELVLVRGHGDYEVVGSTLDDAAGEAFDKVARLLGLPYPGGPAIQSVAAAAAHLVQIPRAWLPGTFDFSFSGVKTAVLHAVFQTVDGGGNETARGRSLPQVDVATRLTHKQVADIAAGFQESVIDILTVKTRHAAEAFDVAAVALVGGVAANRPLRERMAEMIDRPLFISPPQFSTDNAAMIASAAFYVRPSFDVLGVDVLPSLAL